MSGQFTCIITGALGGIGTALCKTYKAAGWHVIATGRERFQDRLACDNYLCADLVDLVRDPLALSTFVAEVRHILNGKPLNSLVNNAALQILGPTEHLSLNDIRRSFDVNVIAPFALVQALLPELRQVSGSTVVNIGTVHAQSTKPSFVAYATSKTALHGLTRSLAVDLGPEIRVNTLAPAATATPMLMAGFEGRSEAFAALSDAHPLSRIASPEEIAKVALFLSGPDSSFMSGATVYADGGVLSRLYDPG